MLTKKKKSDVFIRIGDGFGFLIFRELEDVLSVF